MPARKPKPGDSYVANETIGVDTGALKAGTTVTVREVVAAADAGAHNDSEDAVVVEFDRVYLDENDKPAKALQAVAVAADTFHDLFSEGS